MEIGLFVSIVYEKNALKAGKHFIENYENSTGTGKGFFIPILSFRSNKSTINLCFSRT